MDCKNARLLLEFARPGGRELEAADAEALHQHLAECPDCAAQEREERRADEHLGRAVRDVPVPAGLRERLLKRLTVERDAWYRRWLFRGAAAAAAVAALWLGYHVWFDQLPAVTSAEVRRLADRQGFPTREDVAEAFKELGAPVPVPSQFNYALLDSYDLKSFQGRQVPHLLFAASGNQPPVAHVYVLSERQFDLQQTMQNIGAIRAGSHYRVEVSFSPDKDALYLVLYTGDSVQAFHKHRPR